MIKFIQLKMNQGPWGPWNGPGNSSGNGGGNGAGKNPGNDAKPNLPQKKEDADAFSKKVDEFFKKFEQTKNGGPNNNGGGDFFKTKSPKKVISLAILGVVTLWLACGFYKIDPDENGIILYFGKFSYISTPGLNYYIPYPFGKLIKKSVTAVNTEEFGRASKKNPDSQSLMLTGDENIVDIEFQVQWQISNIEQFTFNIADPNSAIRKAAESAMREVIARTPISEALSDGKSRIEMTTKDLLQQNLDLYKTGVRILNVQLRRVDPPSQVIDAFRDVQTAKADKEKEINEAQAYANDIVPRARGMASQMYEQSEAYRQEVVANAQGEADRFVAVQKQYAIAKQVTKKRMYLETMEKIYRDMDKVVIDKNSAKSNVTTYFPLNDLTKELSQPKKPN